MLAATPGIDRPASGRAEWYAACLDADRLIFTIGVARPGTGTALDDHPVAALGELLSGRGKQRDAVLLFLRFAGDADNHGRAINWPPGSVRFRIPRGRR